MKNLILCLFIVIVSSCSSSDDGNVVNNSQDFNPPTWIHGRWGEAVSNYRFTSNNFFQSNSLSEMDMQAQINLVRSSGGQISVNEIISDNKYSFTIVSTTISMTLKFERINTTSINVYVGDIPLLLNKM
jgi:hypothetical protein